MGFLADIQDMPNQYEHSLRFFDRYYRPEYATIIITGDIQPKEARGLVDKYFGGWKRGSYHADIPAEPKQTGPREAKVPWPTPTLPIIAVAYKGPAYDDKSIDTAALDALATMAFSQTSDLYQKLVVKEQKVDSLNASAPFNVDAGLFTIRARVKKAEDVDYVRREILATVERFQNEPRALQPSARHDRFRQRRPHRRAVCRPEADARHHRPAV
jgi:zinc protease